VDYCDSHFCDVLLCELHYEVEVQPIVSSSPPPEEVSLSELSESQPKKANLRMSFSSGVTGFVDKNLQKVLKFDSGTGIVKFAVENAKCAVGVLVHKQEGSRLKSIKRVVLLYTNKVISQNVKKSNIQNDQLRALKTVLRLPAEIEVTIIAPDEAFRTDSEDRDLKFIQSSTPDVDVVEEAKIGYDLIIVGSSRNSAAVYDSEAIKESTVPVLIVYNEKSARISSVSDITAEMV
jgi:hypothetical protein